MLNQKIGLAVLLGAIAASDAMAQSTLTNFNTGDVLLCFRGQAGLDLVVDAGPITTFVGYAPNSRTVINSYNSTQLNTMGGANNLVWSATAYGSDNTLYETSPRVNLNNQAPAWTPSSPNDQNSTILAVSSVPAGAASNYGHGLNASQSTPTAILEPDSSALVPKDYRAGVSYHDAMLGSYGYPSWGGTFQGDPENITSFDFTTAGAVVRSDLFQMTPDAIASQPLGYFELSTNGVMTYVAYPSTPAVVSAVSENSTVHTITYSTGAYGTYSLRGTNDLTAPISTWPVLQTLPNNANNATVTDTTTDSVRFYTITAQ